MTKLEAEKILKEKGFIKLPPGSYFKWIQQDRFNAYKSVLSFKNGAWIPISSKLAELSRLEEGFKEADFKAYGTEKHAKEEIESIVNGRGDQLPF